MTRRLELHPYQRFPADPSTRSIARTLYAEIADLPIVSLHGHTDPTGLTDDHNWTDATSLPLAPDHYIFARRQPMPPGYTTLSDSATTRAPFCRSLRSRAVSDADLLHLVKAG